MKKRLTRSGAVKMVRAGNWTPKTEGEAIKVLRVGLGLSLRDLRDRCPGVSLSTLSRIENDQRELSSDLRSAISTGLATAFNEMLQRESIAKQERVQKEMENLANLAATSKKFDFPAVTSNLTQHVIVSGFKGLLDKAGLQE